MNILLMGARCSGKTAVGRRLEQRLDMSFVDLDDEALARFPETTVRDVWRVHGEAAWRAAEVDALHAVLERDGRIIALGGGTPMIPQARSRLDSARRSAAVRIVYLQCDADVLAARLRAMTGDRPSLSGRDPAEEIGEVLARREPTYLALADVVQDTAAGSPESVALVLAERFAGQT